MLHIVLLDQFSTQRGGFFKYFFCMKQRLRSHLHFAPLYGRDDLMFSFHEKLKPLSSNITM